MKADMWSSTGDESITGAILKFPAFPLSTLEGEKERGEEGCERDVSSV